MTNINKNVADVEKSHSPLIRTFEVLGDGWTFLILREAFFGARKFEEFQKSLGVSRSRLTERLNNLLKYNVLRRREYSQRPLRYEYLLSESGHDLYGMIMMMMNWGERWRPVNGSLKLKHKTCSTSLNPRLICLGCHESVSLDQVRLSSREAIEERPNFGIRRQLKKNSFENDQRNDPVARTLSVIGDQWTLMVLKQVFSDERTFEIIRKSLGIPRGTLSARLTRLLEEGILRKSTYCEKPIRYSYHLTPAGYDLFSVALMMFRWGETWLFEDENPLYHLVHKPCGERLVPDVVCSTCLETVRSRDVNS